MWWIKDFQEGEFIACNTVQLITKCTLKSAFCFLIEESKNKNILILLKNFWLLQLCLIKKAKSTCLKYAKNCSQEYFMLAEENIF